MNPRTWEEFEKILKEIIGDTADTTTVMNELKDIKTLIGEAESELSEI